MGGQDGVVGLNDGRSHVGCGVDDELELRLLGVVHHQFVHQEGGEPGAGATTKSVEDDEALETVAVVGQGSNPVDDNLHLKYDFKSFP